jgi:hypothetical protein
VAVAVAVAVDVAAGMATASSPTTAAAATPSSPSAPRAGTRLLVLGGAGGTCVRDQHRPVRVQFRVEAVGSREQVHQLYGVMRRRA